MPRRKPAKPGATKERASAEAVHMKNKDGGQHIVGIGNLRVVLVKEEGGWFAQGLEIDYSAQGDTLEQAKTHFENGLEATIDQHLQVYGEIDRMFQVAPSAIWNSLLKMSGAAAHRYSQISVHEIERDAFPFKAISYLTEAAA